MGAVSLIAIGWMLSVFILTGSLISMVVSHKKFGNAGWIPAITGLTVSGFTAVIWYGFLINDPLTGPVVILGTVLLVVFGWLLERSARRMKIEGDIAKKTKQEKRIGTARRLLWFSLIWALAGGLIMKGVILLFGGVGRLFGIWVNAPLWLLVTIQVFVALIAFIAGGILLGVIWNKMSRRWRRQQEARSEPPPTTQASTATTT